MTEEQQKVTAEEILGLGDAVCKLAYRAGERTQYGMRDPLNAALVQILEAARSAAFNEAQEKHNLATADATPTGGKDAP